MRLADAPPSTAPPVEPADGRRVADALDGDGEASPPGDSRSERAALAGGRADAGCLGPSGAASTAASREATQAPSGFRFPLALADLVATPSGQSAPPDGGHDGALRVATYNGNTWGSSLGVYEWMRNLGLPPDAMMIQETRFTSKVAEEQAHGWVHANAAQLAASSVDRTGSGADAAAAGVALGTSKLSGSARPAQAWEGPPHRMAARLLSLSAGCQVAAVALYLEDGAGLNEGNLAVLAELHRWLPQLEMPFIDGRNWNVEAQDLIGSGWPDLVGASVAAPLEPTCNGKTCDF